MGHLYKDNVALSEDFYLTIRWTGIFKIVTQKYYFTFVKSTAYPYAITLIYSTIAIIEMKYWIQQKTETK